MVLPLPQDGTPRLCPFLCTTVAGLSTRNICIIVKVAVIKNEHITPKITIITVYHKVKKMYQAKFAVRGNIIMSRVFGERENFQLLINSPQQSRQWQQRIICESVLFMIRRMIL